MIYTDDNYYLLAFHTQKQEFRHYRVDRMDKVEKTMYDREGREAFANVDMAEYTKYTFSMYRGDKQPVTMRFTNDMVDAVMDRFGRDVLMLKVDDRHFEVTAVVSVSPQFFGWVFGLGNKVEIIRPDNVRQKMKEALECVSKCITAQIMQGVCECRPNGRRRGSGRQACHSAWRHGGTP